MINKQYPSRFEKFLLPSLLQWREQTLNSQLSSAWNGVEFPEFINLKTLISCLEKSYTGPCFRSVQATQNTYAVFVKDQF